MRGLGIGFGVGLGVGGVGAYLVLSRPRQEASPHDATPSRTAPGAPAAHHPAVKHGYPMSTPIRYFSNFAVAYDTSRRNPAWVLEYVNRESSSGPGDRKGSDFYEEPSLEQRFRSRLADFKGSGYDRGHMAPASLHKGSQKDMDETHSLMNISPQVGKGFNRDYWARFERFAKTLITDKHTELFIVTGPLYVPKRKSSFSRSAGWEMNHPMIGQPPGMVAVPTHYYKVILMERPTTDPKSPNKNSFACGAFVMPNAPIDPATPLEAFAVPLTQLESVSGLKFFPGLLTDDKREALDQASVTVRQTGLATLSSLKSIPLLEADNTAPSSSAGSTTSSTDSTATAAPSSGASSGPTQQQSSQKGAGSARYPLHLCQSVACKLPAEDFWIANKKGANAELPE